MRHPTDHKLRKFNFNPVSKKVTGNFILNETTRNLCFEQQAFYLRAKLYSVFYLLLISKGSLLSRDFLIETIWDKQHSIGNKSLTRAIYDLRKILESDPKASVKIITVPKIGYYLQAVENLDSLREMRKSN